MWSLDDTRVVELIVEYKELELEQEQERMDVLWDWVDLVETEMLNAFVDYYFHGLGWD